MKTKTILILVMAFGILSLTSCADHIRSGKIPTHDQKDCPLAIMIENTMNQVNDTFRLSFKGNELHTSSLIRKFYLLNHNHSVWTSEMKPNHYAREMMRLFARAQYYGLDTALYHFTELKELYYTLQKPDNKDLNKHAMQYELLMTHSTFKMMSHLRSGLLYSDTALYGPNLAKFPENFPDKLYKFITESRITEGILALQPNSYEYKRLIKGLEVFLNQMPLNSDAFEMPNPLKDSALAYQKAREILIACNYLKPIKTNFGTDEQIGNSGPNAGNIRESETVVEIGQIEFENALKEFQKSHGLHPDGKIGINTQKALCMNNRQRFEQIAINLERLKWEKPRPEKYVFVNIPSYKLRIINDHNIEKTFNLVVGAPWSQTIPMNSKIEYFTVNPEWFVPYSISSKELLPKIKKDSTYLARHNYKVYDKNRQPITRIDWSGIERNNFSFHLQQSAGSGNAMGKVKFYFPNPYILMIHDTNDKSKFNKDIRAFSHGCMRVQNPEEFTKTMLMVDNSPLSDSIDSWFANGTRKTVSFKEPVPLFVRYITCEADAHGQIYFYQDVYNKDSNLRAAFFKAKQF
jgi:L,D-transpeptidase YcbB